MPARQRLDHNALHALTPASLGRLGRRFGIDYRFDAGPAHAPLATGLVHHARLEPALHLTLSDLDITRAYTSCSRRPAPWLLSVVLDGRIHAAMGEREVHLAPGDGVCAHLTAHTPLRVSQPAQPALRTVTLAVMAPGLLAATLPPAHGMLHAFRLPEVLTQSLRYWLNASLGAWRDTLVWQGLALQLLAAGVPDPRPGPALPPGERQRLEALRTRLADNPTAAYTLSALAAEAAMSPSSLRHKFHACYGCSVFDYLRRCRLELGYSHLQQGDSVQQAAHACGYRHATNFSAAFRRLFGCSPREITRG